MDIDIVLSLNLFVRTDIIANKNIGYASIKIIVKNIKKAP